MSTPITNFMVGDWAYVKDHPMAETPMHIKPEHFVRSLCEFREIPLNVNTLIKSGFKETETDTYIYEVVAGDGHTTIKLYNRLDGIWDIEAETLGKFTEIKKSIVEYGVFLKVNQLQRIFRELEHNDIIEYENND